MGHQVRPINYFIIIIRVSEGEKRREGAVVQQHILEICLYIFIRNSFQCQRKQHSIKGGGHKKSYILRVIQQC